MGLCASAPADKYSTTQEAGKQNNCAESDGRGDAAAKQPVQPIPQPEKQILAVHAEEKAAPSRKPSSVLPQGCSQQTCGGSAGLKLAEAVCPPDELIGNIIDPINGPAAGLPYKVHYLGPPPPPCEGERLATARALGRIDDPSEDPEITNILQLCSSIFAAPVSLCALFDDQRVFISEQDGSVIPRGNFPWRWTLCGWSLAFKNPQILVIPDTHQDARFANNLKVTEPPHVRFYCGAPLVASNGHRLGTLCFADIKPRTFDQASCMIMNNLSELVVRQLEKGIALKAKAKDNNDMAATYGQLQRAFDAFEHCVLLLDVSKENGWKVMYTNNMLQKLTGLVRDDVMGKLIQDLFEEGDGSSVLSAGLQQAIANNKNYRVRVARVRGTDSTAGGSAVMLTFRPAAKEHLDEHTMQIGVPAFLPVKAGDNSGAAQQKLYFVTVDTVTTPMSGVSNLSSGRLSSLLSTNASGVEIEGLEVGHLLGRGTFGSVYYGTYNNAPVAVKVIESDTSKTGPLLEAVLSQQMNHPHIVSTLKYFHRVMKPSAPASVHDSAASPLHSGLGMHDFVGTGRNPLLDAGDSATGNGWNQAKKGVSNDGGTVSSGPNSGANAMSASNVVAIDATAQLAPEISSLAPGAPGVAPSSPPLRPAAAAAKSTGDTVTGSCGDHSIAGTRAPREWRQTWLVMEYADCGSLQEVLDRGWMHLDRSNVARGPNIAAVLATAAEIASALQYLHGKQIVHGDLSGWNIMLCSKGASAAVGGRNFVAKVGDFGLSRSLEVSNEVMTKSYGTLTHQPPETLTHGIVSRATDVYSFGVLMWQMYTGSRPWCGLSHAQVIMQVGNQGAKLKWPANTPPSLRSLAEACMHADVAVRPTFDDIVTHLATLQKELLAADGSGPELGLEGQWL